MKPYYDDGKGIVIYHGDNREILPMLPKVDLLLTDPPYNFESKGGGLYATHHHLDTIRESFGTDFDPKEFLGMALVAFEKNLLIWFGNRLLPIYLNWAIENGLNWDLMFWHKVNAMPNYGGKLMSDTEICLRAFRAGKSFVAAELGYDNYRKWHLDNVQSNNGHPTPKPIDLILRQINLFLPDGGTVVDCFCGSGTTLRAAKDLGHKAIGIEIEERYAEIAARRLSQEVLDFT